MEIEGQESVVETSESMESQSTAPESSQPEQSAQASAPQPKDETPIDWDKAFKHERFKDLIDQKNKALESTRALELKLAQLEGKLSQPQAQQQERDELLEDLKKIDPRLAARLEAFGNSSKTIEQLQAKLDQFEKAQQQQSQQQIVQQSVAKINSLHESNKVPEPIKAAINAQLDVMYMQGKLNPQNLEAAYKSAYEPYKAFLEETKREALKSYVPSKQADAKVPTSQPKGQQASKPKPSNDKMQFKDRDELRAAVAKEYVQSARAKREASPV
jgi:plasmid maintenance system antidote protein VapI